MTIVARKDFEPNNLEELVTYVKDNADKVTLANAGVGAASQLCGLLIEKAVGVDLNEVPYDGTGPALTDLVGGQVDFMCDQTTNTDPQIKAGKVKAYAVTTPERIEALPDLQTTAEAGLPDIEVGVWHGLYVPAETPDEVVKKLTDALAIALEDQAVIDKLADLGTEPAPQDDVTPEAHTTLLKEQIDLWTPDHRRGRRQRVLTWATPETAVRAGPRSAGALARHESSLDDVVAGVLFVGMGLGFAIGARGPTSWVRRSGWDPAMCRSPWAPC